LYYVRGAGETGLSWLPLVFPAHVRVILSATSVSPQDATSKKLHVICEVERRQWQITKLKPLEVTVTRNIITSFIRKTVQSESSTTVDGTFLTSFVSQQQLPQVHGFVMFENQISEICTHKLASNPLFLKILLRCAHWAVTRGYDLWSLLEVWLTSTSVEDMYVVVLESLEKGYTADYDTRHVAQTCATMAGGFQSLKQQYPWHPGTLCCVVCISNIKMHVYVAGVKRMDQSTLNESNAGVEFDASDLIR
jgi:hypothetical protein